MLALLLLWSFVFDATMLQAHRHPARTAVHGEPAERPVIADLDDDCPLCAAAASIEPLLPPTPFAPLLPSGGIVATVAVASTTRARSSRGHIWRSRAPPDAVATS